MRLLLDTRAFLWFIEGEARLSDTAVSIIGDPDNKRKLSVASVWEIAIEVNLGKLRTTVSGPLEAVLVEHLSRNQVDLLPVEIAHAVGVHSLPFARAGGTEHKDPFDRLIVSQALAEGLTLVSSDAVFDLYGVARC